MTVYLLMSVQDYEGEYEKEYVRAIFLNEINAIKRMKELNAKDNSFYYYVQDMQIEESK